MKTNNYMNLTPEQILFEISKLTSADRARLNTGNYAAYPGSANTPKSPLTSKAQTFSGQYGQNLPYNSQISSVLGRSGQGFNPATMSKYLSDSQNRQAEYGANTISPMLQNQFGAAYAPYAADFNRMQGIHNAQGMEEFRSKFSNLADASNTLEKNRNRSITGTLQGAQKDTQNRQNATVALLEQLGRQEQGYGNIVNDAKKQSFAQEVAYPEQQLKFLEGAMTPLQQELDKGDNAHPDLKRMRGKEAAAALAAYKRNTNLPTNNQTGMGGNGANGIYNGTMVAPLPPEILSTYKAMGNLSPDYQDQYAAPRNAILNQAANGGNLTDQVLQNLPGQMEGRLGTLERKGQERLNEDIRRINNDFTKINQYGSPAHLNAVQKRASQVNKAVLEHRNDATEQELGGSLQRAHSGQIADLEKAQLYGQQGQTEYGNMLQQVLAQNKVGADKWMGDQDEVDKKYQNFQNEGMWQYPHMRQSLRSEALNDILGVQKAQKDINLDKLNLLNTRYSDLENRYNMDMGRMGTENDTLRKIQAELDAQKGSYKQQLTEDYEKQRLAQERAIQAQQQQIAEREGTLNKQNNSLLQEAAFNSPLSIAQFKTLNPDNRLKYLDVQARKGWAIPLQQRMLMTPEESAAQQWLLADVEGRPYNLDMASNHLNGLTATRQRDENTRQERQLAYNKSTGLWKS